MCVADNTYLMLMLVLRESGKFGKKSSLVDKERMTLGAMQSIARFEQEGASCVYVVQLSDERQVRSSKSVQLSIQLFPLWPRVWIYGIGNNENKQCNSNSCSNASPRLTGMRLRAPALF